MSESMPMMRCGDVANARSYYGDPICAIHASTARDADARTPVEAPPIPADRLAECAYCRKTAPSTSWQRLAFFSSRPERDRDSFYDGCRGWE